MALYHYCIMYKNKQHQAKIDGSIVRKDTLKTREEYRELADDIRKSHNLENNDIMIITSLSLISR